MRFWIVAVAVVFATQAPAATVVKCVDASGKVTFVQNSCPGGASGAELEVKASQRPSGDGPAVKMADPSKTYIKKEPRPVRRAAPAPAPQQEVAEQEPAPRGGVVQQNAHQPCVKFVERHVNSTKIMPDGRRRGRSEIVKVPVPC